MGDKETCPTCGGEFVRIRQHYSMSECKNPDKIEYESLAMFSGGHDSLVMTHYCMENDLTEAVLHLDTGTGIDENVQFVKDVCAEYGWDLIIREAKKDFKEYVLEWGFPSGGSHSWAYRYLKEHTLVSVASDCVVDKPKFYTGVRRSESDRRMRTVEAEKQETRKWIWMAPIADWTQEDCDVYIDNNELPRNPVVGHIHRSGECFCGAFATRDEQLIDLQAHYPDHAEWLMELEKEVQDEIGTEENYCWWGNDGLKKDEMNELIDSDDRDNITPMLCRGCENAQRE